MKSTTAAIFRMNPSLLFQISDRDYNGALARCSNSLGVLTTIENAFENAVISRNAKEGGFERI